MKKRYTCQICDTQWINDPKNFQSFIEHVVDKHIKELKRIRNHPGWGNIYTCWCGWDTDSKLAMINHLLWAADIPSGTCKNVDSDKIFEHMHRLLLGITP